MVIGRLPGLFQGEERGSRPRAVGLFCCGRRASEPPGYSAPGQSVAGCCWDVDVTGCDEPSPLGLSPNLLPRPLTTLQQHQSTSSTLAVGSAACRQQSLGEPTPNRSRRRLYLINLPSVSRSPPPATPADPGLCWAGLVRIFPFHQKEKKQTCARKSDATPATTQCPVPTRRVVQ